MRIRRRRIRLRWIDLIVFPVLALLVYFGLPSQWGGHTSYIVIRGDSMEPTYRTGDLVVLRESSAFHPGDIVAYRVPEGDFGEGTIVIHRIVATGAAGRFILQGDNNPELDGWEPTDTDIVGKPIFSLPRLGAALAVLRDPLLLGSLAFGATIAMAFAPPRRERGRHIAPK